MKIDFAPVPEIKSVAVITAEDLEPYIEHNKKLQAMEQTRTDGMMHYARIPNHTMVEWLNEEWNRGNFIRYLSAEFYAMVDRKLADPANANLRVVGPRHRVGYGD